VGSQRGRDIERKCRRRQETGQCWQKSKTLWRAREPKKEMEAGRDWEKHGRDGPRRTTHHSSLFWQETFTAPRLLSLPLPPSPLQCQLPDPCPPRNRWQVPQCFSPTRLPRCTVMDTCSLQRHRAPGAVRWQCALSRMAGRSSSMPWGLAVSCWRQLPVEPPLFHSSASSCRQACPGSPLPSWSPLAQQGWPHPEPQQLHPGLPQAHPHLQPF